jgi:hypothetical protein
MYEVGGLVSAHTVHVMQPAHLLEQYCFVSYSGGADRTPGIVGISVLDQAHTVLVLTRNIEGQVPSSTSNGTVLACSEIRE